MRRELRIEYLGWAAQDLQAYRKGNLRKARIARRLRQETADDTDERGWENGGGGSGTAEG